MEERRRVLLDYKIFRFSGAYLNFHKLCVNKLFGHERGGLLWYNSLKLFSTNHIQYIIEITMVSYRILIGIYNVIDGWSRCQGQLKNFRHVFRKSNYSLSIFYLPKWKRLSCYWIFPDNLRKFSLLVLLFCLFSIR